jgi:hypothetical protein
LNAYAAGLLDGEGCVRWNRTPAIEVTNKHRGILVQMQDKWGGSVRLKDDAVYVWTLCGAKALAYLACVSRYSVIKHPQIVELFKAARSTGRTRDQHIKNLKRLKNVYTH